MAAVASSRNPSLILAAGVLLVTVGLGATWMGPTRHPLFIIIFVSLALDSMGEGPWDSPLAPFGTLLSANLNKSITAGGPLPGVAVLMLLVWMVQTGRRLTGARPEGDPVSPPLRLALLGSLATVVLLTLWGQLHGGDLQMAKNQVQSFVLTLLMVSLCAAAFRAVDYRTLGKIIVAAACIKAVTAVYVVSILPTAPEYATSHGDSVLFALATVMLLVQFAECPGRRTALWCLALLPLLAWGMAANDRRLVWVQILGCVMLYWVVSGKSRAKRVLVRLFILASPLIVAYIAVGWTSQSTVFVPVQSLRSTGVFGADQQMDSSTLYRELENYNLMMTMRHGGPLLGTGFGHPFLEVITLPSIAFFREYRYMPHNSTLGLWGFTGALGFTGISLVLLVAIFLAKRSYVMATSPEQRIAAFMVLAVILIHGFQAWGDIGFSERKTIFVLGPALAIAGQLAAATGAWRTEARKRGQGMQRAA